MKTVIYHSADYDGIFCREIAKRFLGEQDVQYIGWNFGDPPVTIPETPEGRFSQQVYIMDLPPECVAGLPETWTEGMLDDPVIWIDHHKTSIETWPKAVPGYRIDGVAACRLVWQWFGSVTEGIPHDLPKKQDFVDRKVSEPLAVRLAGEYDVWDHRGDGDLELQFGLIARDNPPFALLLESSERGREMTNQIIAEGQTVMAYSKHVDASICNSLTWVMEWEGLKFLCVNHARFNSLLFAAKDKPETGHDALLGFRFDGKSWMVSLYHAAHRKDLDLSAIAVKHGGGGHKGACGFTCQKLPFMPASAL